MIVSIKSIYSEYSGGKKWKSKIPLAEKKKTNLPLPKTSHWKVQNNWKNIPPFEKIGKLKIPFAENPPEKLYSIVPLSRNVQIKNKNGLQLVRCVFFWRGRFVCQFFVLFFLRGEYSIFLRGRKFVLFFFVGVWLFERASWAGEEFSIFYLSQRKKFSCEGYSIFLPLFEGRWLFFKVLGRGSTIRGGVFWIGKICIKFRISFTANKIFNFSIFV